MDRVIGLRDRISPNILHEYYNVPPGAIVA
jgi:hypothetical protein